MLRVVFYASFILVTTAPVIAQPDRNFRRGFELMKELAYDQAILAMPRALAHSSNTAQDRALILQRELTR